MAAIEENSENKMASTGVPFGRILRYLLYKTKWLPVRHVEAFSFGKTVHKFNDDVNASARNASPVFWQYKCMYSYITKVSILYICLSIYNAKGLIKQHC